MSVYSDSEGEEEGVAGEGAGKQLGQRDEPHLPAIPERILSPKTASSEYVSCASELEVSSPLNAGRGGGGGGGGDRSLLTTGPREHAESYSTDPLPLEEENGQTGQLHPPTRFNNLLDECNADESDVVRPKPRVAPPTISSTPQTNLATVFQAADDEVPRINDQPPSPSSTPPSSLGGNNPDKMEDFLHNHHTSSPEVMSPSPLEGFPLMGGGEGPMLSYLFPISNSPMDIVTMLSRLASFTGELLLVMTPKIQKTNKVSQSHVPFPEVQWSL